MADLIIALWVWLVPATLAAAVVALLMGLVQLAGGSPWFVWLLLSPTLYVCWLVSFLFFCAKTIAPMGRRFPKPRRATLPGAEPGRLRTVIAGALRRRVIYSLPLVPLLEQSAWGRKLIILGYAPSMHIGSGVQMASNLEDPDLTELGDRVVLGAGVAIAAHLWTNLPSCKRVYITAPVVIGSRATIGAYSTVSCGCRIGEDAILEPHSYLPPHTEIPAGEIWGGRPATFQRKRARAVGKSA
jgi:acetyltransferase-like isoleucine patch superfamily enzyme